MKPKSVTHPMSEATKKKLSESRKGIRPWNYKGRSENESGRLRRKKLRDCEGSHTQGEWELLKKQYGYTCPSCKLAEPFVGQRCESLTEDHIIPLSKGGSDWIENIQPLCLSCNVKKHTKIIKY